MLSRLCKVGGYFCSARLRLVEASVRQVYRRTNFPRITWGRGDPETEPCRKAGRASAVMVPLAPLPYQYFDSWFSSFVMISSSAGRPSVVTFTARFTAGMISSGASTRSV